MSNGDNRGGMAVGTAGTGARKARKGTFGKAAVLGLVITLAPPTALAVGDRTEFPRESLFSQALDIERLSFEADSHVSLPAERGDRVRKSSRVAAFSAGTLERASGVLQSGIAAGDDFMRTTIAGPVATLGETILAAFEQRPTLDWGGEVRLASLGPATGDSGNDAGTSELAYGPSAGPSIASRFDDLLGGPGKGFVPPLGDKDHSWAATPLDAQVYSKKEQTCLATGIYFEARGESEEGQAAVAQVILNRVRAPSYPDTICGVVYQNAHWKNRCQFSFACDGIPDRITNRRAYTVAERIALEVTNGETWLAEVGSSTHYHATYVKPRWARAMDRVDKIGLHVFYRTLNGGWN